MSISKNLSRIMRQKKIGGKELAGILKVPPSSVSRWVSGVQEPRASVLKRIADALRVPVGALFDEVDEVEKAKELFSNLENTGYVSILDGTYRIRLRVEKKIDSKEG